MSEKKCSKCDMDLTDENTCKCDKEKCKEDCSCDNECSCGCKKEDKKDEE